MAPAGGRKQDQWFAYTLEIFIASFWPRSRLATAERFFGTQATAAQEKFTLLCEGIAGPHYFAVCNERSLGSIPGTMVLRRRARSSRTAAIF